MNLKRHTIGLPRLLVTGLFLFFCLESNSQNFSGRLILGINGSQIDGDGMAGYYKGGLVAGLATRFPVSEKLSFGPEIMYSQKGSKASFEQVTEQGFPPVIFRVNYMDMALMADYKLDHNRALIEAGPSLGYRLNARLDNGTNLGFVDVTDQFKPLDFQLVMGLKYEIFDNCWLGGRILYSVVSTNAQGLDNFNFRIVGGQTRGGFFNNLLQFSVTLRAFGAKDLVAPVRKSKTPAQALPAPAKST